MRIVVWDFMDSANKIARFICLWHAPLQFFYTRAFQLYWTVGRSVVYPRNFVPVGDKEAIIIICHETPKVELSFVSVGSVILLLLILLRAPDHKFNCWTIFHFVVNFWRCFAEAALKYFSGSFFCVTFTFAVKLIKGPWEFLAHPSICWSSKTCGVVLTRFLGHDILGSEVTLRVPGNAKK